MAPERPMDSLGGVTTPRGAGAGYCSLEEYFLKD